MTTTDAAVEDRLYDRISAILRDARNRVARSVNTAMVHAYWLVGREIVVVEQEGKERAGYGEGVMKGVAARLATELGKGFSLATLKRMRQFYIAFPSGSALPDKGSTVLSLSAGAAGSEKSSTALSLSTDDRPLFPPLLGWSHYLVLLRVQDPQARSFYDEAARESWSVRELERQVAALLFERLAMSRDAEQVRALARQGLQVAVPGDVIKDPFVLEFLDLREKPTAQERDLEQAIIGSSPPFSYPFDEPHPSGTPCA